MLLNQNFHGHRAILKSLILCFAFGLWCSAALAQATTGTIRGNVVDTTGAAIVEAIVTAQNQATGVKSAAFKTTSEGLFVIPNLAPGLYDVQVERRDFNRGFYTGLEVRLGQDTALTATLQPGEITITITISVNAEEALQSETAQLSSNFAARKVAELPSNIAGGGIDTLALLMPGVVPGFGFTNANGTSFSVNGNRERANNFTIDGQDNNDLSIGGPNYFVDNQDVVADFQIITNNFSARYGRNQGAIVNIATKGGTNEWHGSGFWFHRNRKLFDTMTNLEKLNPDRKDPDPLLYNVFGGTLGGPIKRDRAFIFGSYQRVTSRETRTLRTGNLAILPDELPRLKTVFPNNAAIAALADYGAFAIANVGTVRPRTDLPGVTDTITLTDANGVPRSFRAAFPERVLQTPFDQNEFTLRSDIKLTNKDDVWARYLFQHGNSKNALATNNGFTGDSPFRSQNLGATYTRQLTSYSVNEFRFAYTRLFLNFGGGCSGKGCIPDPTQIGQAFTDLSFNGIRGDDTGATLQAIGPGGALPQGRTVETFQFADNYTFARGRHTLTAGVDVRWLRNRVAYLPFLNGSFEIGGAEQLVANAPLRVSLTVGEDTIRYKETDHFYYFQDDWKARDNLTLNLGVRYENTGQPLNLLNDLTTVRESDPSQALWRQNIPLASRVVPRVPTDNNNWAPRIGFAYTPRVWQKLLGKDATVLRGGFSIAYEPAFYNIMLNISTASPSVFSNLTTNSLTAPAFPVPDANPTGDKVRAFAQSRRLIDRNLFDPRFFFQSTVSPDFHSPYSMQWSLGLQRQINRNNVVEARYVATRGIGLFQSLNRNPKMDNLLNGFTTSGFSGTEFSFPSFAQLFPRGLAPLTCTDNPATLDDESVCHGRLQRAGQIYAVENAATSIYHGLQTRYSGYLFNQLTMGAGYTWSKAIDTASEIFDAFERSIPQNPLDITRGQRGLSGFDRRHVFSLNGIWDIPFAKEQHGVRGRVLGGWQINSVYLLSSGQRFTPLQFSNGFFDTYVDPLFGDMLRPFAGNGKADPRSVAISDVDAILLGYVPDGTLSPTGFFSFNALNTTGNPQAVTPNDVRFIFNGPGAAKKFGTPFGTAARNSLAGPKINQLNAGFFKNIKVTEQVKLQFRTEVFNLFNHPQPGYGFYFRGEAIPNPYVESAGGPGYAFNTPKDMEFGRRILQFGLRITF
ncbi:MAG: TonB-dependent receptor [Acidobacteria bacterium]|nr:TonB-dependent receptor [Acidobacteriota bacterium]